MMNASTFNQPIPSHLNCSDLSILDLTNLDALCVGTHFFPRLSIAKSVALLNPEYDNYRIMRVKAKPCL